MMKKFLCSLLVFIIIITSSAIAFSKSMGDVNSDGNVNSSDALLILKSSVGMNPADFNASLADMNEDGNINSSDALIVLKISVGLIQPDEEKEDPLKFDKSQLIEYYNSCLKKSYSYEINATKVEQVDMKVSDVGMGGSAAINTDSLVNSIIANNTKNNGVVQTKSFTNGKATDDNSPVEKFVAPTNLYDEAVRTINIQKNGTGYQIVINLKSESCPYNETAEYNASCSWPLDINAIDFGQAITIQECTFNYPGTRLVANIDSEGRVTTLKTEMPLTVTNATAKAMGINITVGSIEGKWTCQNTMAFVKPSEPGSSNNRPNSGSNNKPSTDKDQVDNTQPAPSMKEIIEAVQSVTKDNITIDANGNLTIKNDEGKDTGLFGFKYSTTEKCFITSEDAWQRQYGYNENNDASAPVLAISYDTMRVYFDYDGLQWMIQYWKGQYGLILVGAEIGI